MIVDLTFWYQVKELIRQATGWPMDTLHVMAGVMLQLLAAALMRCSLSDRRPLMAVLLLELLNELYDLWVERWPSLSMQLGEGLKDLIGTLLLPTILWWVARRRPRLLTAR